MEKFILHSHVFIQSESRFYFIFISFDVKASTDSISTPKLIIFSLCLADIQTKRNQILLGKPLLTLGEEIDFYSPKK